MKPTDDFSDMKLTAIVAEFMKSKEWNDDIDLDDNKSTAEVNMTLGIDGQGYRSNILIREKAERIFVSLYSPFNIPVKRLHDFCVIANRINDRLSFGSIYCTDDGEANPVRFSISIDLEGGNLSVKQVDNLLGAGFFAFSYYGETLSAIALTKAPYEEIWKNLLDEEAKAEEENKNKKVGPTEL